MYKRTLSVSNFCHRHRIHILSPDAVTQKQLSNLSPTGNCLICHLEVIIVIYQIGVYYQILLVIILAFIIKFCLLSFWRSIVKTNCGELLFNYLRWPSLIKIHWFGLSKITCVLFVLRNAAATGIGVLPIRLNPIHLIPIRLTPIRLI